MFRERGINEFYSRLHFFPLNDAVLMVYSVLAHWILRRWRFIDANSHASVTNTPINTLHDNKVECVPIENVNIRLQIGHFTSGDAFEAEFGNAAIWRWCWTWT